MKRGMKIGKGREVEEKKEEREKGAIEGQS
jgi:hypothetical protein